jgi:RHS repeat-associated protein
VLEDHHDASGLLYRRNRYYNPQTGRFTQEDPIGLAGGMNAYGFANGDPASYADPYGLCPSCNLNFGLGYFGRLDQFDTEGSSRYEIHVYKGDEEVGVVGPGGWIRKHGRHVAEVPRDVLNKINGENVTQLRRRGMLPEQGEANIRGGRYMEGMEGAERLLGVIGWGLDLLNVIQAERRSRALGVSVWWYMSVQMVGGDPEDPKTQCPRCA